MSIVTEKYIMCDGDCNRNTVDSLGFSIKQMRESLKEESWKRIGKKDFCFQCFHKIKNT